MRKQVMKKIVNITYKLLILKILLTLPEHNPNSTRHCITMRSVLPEAKVRVIL